MVDFGFVESFHRSERFVDEWVLECHFLLQAQGARGIPSEIADWHRIE